MFADGNDDDNDSMLDLDEAPPHQHAHHNPFGSDDPDEGDISNLQFTQTAPGRFNVQATITRSVSPQQFRAAGGMAPASIGGFMSMLNGLTRVAGQAQGQQERGQGEGLFSGINQNQNQSAFHEAQGQGAPGLPRVTASRFTYTGGARLFPRDANNPEPRMEPVDDITKYVGQTHFVLKETNDFNSVVTGLMAALGAPPGSLHAAQHHAGGAEAQFRGEQDGQAHMHPAHPFLQLFSSLGMAPGGNMGDFVYSQEGLDRIVSQLMEQTASSNAPPPAQPSDIDNLPRKKVDEEMLGAEHKAECSICMDEVNIGEEVTLLPCKHWFHHQCVSAWLGEHDTCPHCRKSISKHDEQSQNSPPQAQTISGAPAINRTRSMPGAFDVSGSGTSADPFVVAGDTGAATTGNQADANSSSENNSMSDRIRRGLFGPQQ
jgi:E3 ubiquitin-protein ligase RNF115/126